MGYGVKAYGDCNGSAIDDLPTESSRVGVLVYPWDNANNKPLYGDFTGASSNVDAQRQGQREDTTLVTAMTDNNLLFFDATHPLIYDGDYYTNPDPFLIINTLSAQPSPIIGLEGVAQLMDGFLLATEGNTIYKTHLTPDNQLVIDDYINLTGIASDLTNVSAGRVGSEPGFFDPSLEVKDWGVAVFFPTTNLAQEGIRRLNSDGSSIKVTGNSRSCPVPS